MANENISPVQITQALNQTSVDPKSAMRISQAQIKTILSQLGDDTVPLVLNGKEYWGTEKFRGDVLLILNSKMEELNNQTTSILSVFNELYKLEKSISGM